MSSNASVRMGTAYAPSANGSAQGQYRDRLGALREDDASLRLGALREDDASLRLGTAYNPNAFQSAQSRRVQYLQGLREQDMGLHLGDRPSKASRFSMGALREDDASLRLGVFADQYNAGAFQSKISGLGVRARPMVVGREVGSHGRGGSGSMNAQADYRSRQKMRDQYSAYVAARRPGPDIIFRGALPHGSLYASGVLQFQYPGHHQMGALREDDARLRLGDLRADDSSVALGDMRRDFHPRLPVKIEMKGLGSGTHYMTGAQIAGLFDFLKANPTDTENMARVRAIANTWAPLQDIISRLPADKQNAVVAAIGNLDTSVSDINFVVTNYVNNATFTRENMNRMTRIEAALPTIQKLVADMQAFAGPPGSAGAAANHSIVTDINNRANGITTGLTAQNVVIGVVGGAIGIGVIYAVIKALQKN